MTKEVKNDVTDDEVKEFEEAEEAGEVKTSGERELETDESDGSKEESEESDTTDESEEEEESEDDSEESEEDVEVDASTTIKEVDGETPREKALRLEVTRLRAKGRAREQKELLTTEKEPDSTGYEEELKELGYDDEQINTLDKAFDIIGKKKGFVRKEQTYATMANDTLAEFVEEHPEYSPDNDKDDVYWGRFQSILKEDYKLANKSSKQLKSIFNRVDKEIKEELGEKVVDKKVVAQKQKVKSASAGASTSNSDKAGETTTKAKSNDKTVVSSGHPGLNFQGFDDDEVDEFTK